jgi:ribose 5-phosphate isomerase B
MEIFIGADHKGLELKNQLRHWLEQQAHTVVDVGAEKLDPNDDYPVYAFKVAEAVKQNPEERRGIVICGSGVGMAVAANKVPGIRAALIHDEAIARAARNDDDINVLALGADYIAPESAKQVIETWLATPFAGTERYVRRLKEIDQYAPDHD